MIYQTIHDGINQHGSSCTLTEYDSRKKYPLKGIFQSVGIKNREHSQIDYTRHGRADESDLLFIFNGTDNSVEYENAVLCDEHDNRYYIRKCKPFYYKQKILYYIAVVVPCSGEVVA